MEILKVENLSFTYPKNENKTLKNVDFGIGEGEIILICGTSGSGKSTLLRHFKSCLTPHGIREGRVLFGGKTLDDIDFREQTQRIGFVLQHPDDQIVTDKVWHELAFGLESLGTDKSTMRLRIGEMANYFGIQNWFYKNVNELSGGQKQLLNLASVMAMNPDILILDEPTSQLDPIAAADFLSTLRKLNRELGITIIFTEHRLEEAFSMADRVMVMQEGECILYNTPKVVAERVSEESDIFHALPSPVKLYRELGIAGGCPLTVRDGRKLLSEMNLIKTEIKSDAVNSNAGNKQNKALEISECWFRYEKESEDVLRGLNMSVYSGEVYSVVGGNGTGKSTTLSVISGINRPYRGKIKIFNETIKKINAKKNGIAVLTQDPRTLFVRDTVESDLREMLSDMDKFSCEAELLNVAELMEIENLMDRHPFDLSGGEQQRVAMAKVLLMKPQIMLLDEPTKGMDAHFKIKLGMLLRKLAKHGMAIIIVSHDVEFCAEYSDRCGLFFDGAIIAENEPREFFSGNHFYTTAANRMARSIFKNAVLTKEITELCMKQLKKI